MTRPVPPGFAPAGTVIASKTAASASPARTCGRTQVDNSFMTLPLKWSRRFVPDSAEQTCLSPVLAAAPSQAPAQTDESIVSRFSADRHHPGRGGCGGAADGVLPLRVGPVVADADVHRERRI